MHRTLSTGSFIRTISRLFYVIEVSDTVTRITHQWHCCIRNLNNTSLTAVIYSSGIIIETVSNSILFNKSSLWGEQKVGECRYKLGASINEAAECVLLIIKVGHTVH